MTENTEKKTYATFDDLPPEVKGAVNLLPADFIRRGWARGVLARDGAGLGTSPSNPNARSWCLLGACDAAGVSADPLYLEWERRGHREVPLWNGREWERRGHRWAVSQWNDDPRRTKREVVELLEVAWMTDRMAVVMKEEENAT